MANQYGSNHRGDKQNSGAGQGGKNDQSVNQSDGKKTQPAASGRQNQGSDTSGRNQGTAASSTRGGTGQQPAQGGQQSHKNDK